MPLESEFGAAGVIDVLSVVDVCGGDEASTKNVPLLYQQSKSLSHFGR